ncbi:MAG TPA: ATPase, T2SS/T4P/T4SS family [Acetobacteraceae bacterium]|jgi:general secretion pathway protein E|nr:ATPase, T2SS/T4P/T4SS family [Acetobacteraceae bacterium]
MDTGQTMTALADLLVTRGQCDTRTLERARSVASETGQRLDLVLMQLGLLTERGLAETYAALFTLPIAEPGRYPVDAAPFADELPPRFLRQAHALPLAIEDDALVVATADPLDAFTPAAIAAATGQAVRLEVAIPVELEAALERLYPSDEQAGQSPDETAATSLEDDAERLKDLASEAPVIRLVNQVITRAVETNASDIHLEPFEDRLRVRYRYDGVLHEAENPPIRLARAITSRIKIMSRLDIAERRLPQDGRIRLAVRGQEVDFRVSTVPSLHGETVVLRILDRTAVAFDYARLGLPPTVIDRFRAALALPNGIVLVTGPTGSGKTTTLYTGLLALNSIERKIVTVEDPIEYRLNGITQMQVHEQIGLTFAEFLSAIVRQDPDVIMVGEIRNRETAQVAAQGALLGRLVLSTLHTNSAAAAVTRLRDMGLEDYLLAAVLRGVLAQRLVRRLCPDCRQAAPAPAELIDRFGLPAHGNAAPRVYHAVGCAACRHTGYRGRFAIAEFLPLDEEVEQLIFARADHSTIERAAVAAGMISLFQCGLTAALAGETTIEEVVRSVRAET